MDAALWTVPFKLNSLAGQPSVFEQVVALDLGRPAGRRGLGAHSTTQHSRRIHAFYSYGDKQLNKQLNNSARVTEWRRCPLKE